MRPNSRDRQLTARARARAFQGAGCFMTALASLSFVYVPTVLRLAPTPIYQYVNGFVPGSLALLLLLLVAAFHGTGLYLTRRIPPADGEKTGHPSVRECYGACMCVVGNIAQVGIWFYLAAVYIDLFIAGQPFLSTFLCLCPALLSVYTVGPVIREAWDWKRATLRRAMANRSGAEQMEIIERHERSLPRAKVSNKTHC